ncbi:STU2-like protein [Giardia muris]|uniref:STU2-like protein n=1 Tax=Giardia muris TaxID=5742 RepID=A0A4Z1T262_GIAMU|nr:STU2-like protein [Giardia muris]|eukprot:TNJ26501.1 STU2-like protein [Giardia muris]
MADQDDSQSKSEWKTRLEFIQALNAGSTEDAVMQLSHVFPQALRDSNVLCLTAALQLLDKVKDSDVLHAWPVLQELAGLLVYPCSVNAKAGIRAKAIQLVLDLSVSARDVMLGAITGAIQSTNPGQVRAGLQVLTQLVKERGTGAFDVSDVVFLVVHTLQAKEADVRKASQEAIAQIMEADTQETRDLMVMLESELPKAHFQALVAAVAEKVSGTVPNATKNKAAVHASAQNANTRRAKSTEQGALDVASTEIPFLQIEPGWEVVLSTASSKWEEKQLVLKQLSDELLNTTLPRVPNSTSWQNLCRTLKQLLDTENNQACVIQTMKAIGIFALSADTFPAQLGKQFGSGLLARFKDKKPAIIQQVNKTLLNLLLCQITSTELTSEYLGTLTSKSPDQRLEVLRFLTHCFSLTSIKQEARLEECFEAIRPYLRRTGLTLSSLIENLRPRLTLTTKAVTALVKAALPLITDASQAVRTACTEMLSACCIFHMSSPQHVVALSEVLFQPVLSVGKGATATAILDDIVRYNSSNSGGSSAEVQRLRTVVQAVQQAIVTGAITLDGAVVSPQKMNPPSTRSSPVARASSRQNPTRATHQASPTNKKASLTPRAAPTATQPTKNTSPVVHTTARSRPRSTSSRQPVKVPTTAPQASLVPVVPAVPATSTSAPASKSRPVVSELIINPLDSIAESLILDEALLKPFRLSSLFLDVTNSLLLAGPSEVMLIDIGEFIDTLSVVGSEIFGNFDLSLLALDPPSITAFLGLIGKFVGRCTIDGALDYYRTGSATTKPYLLKVVLHSTGNTDNLCYSTIQKAFSRIFEFLCRYLILLFALPLATAPATFRQPGIYTLPQELLTTVYDVLRQMVPGCFSQSSPSLAGNSVSTIIPVMTRTLLLLPEARRSLDLSRTVTATNDTTFPLFIQVSQDPRQILNIVCGELLLVSDPTALQYEVNIVELANVLSVICNELLTEDVSLFPSVAHEDSIDWCLTTTLDLIEAYEGRQDMQPALQGLFRSFLLALQRQIPLTVLTAAYLSRCPPTLQQDVLELAPYPRSDARLVKIITQLSVPDTDILASLDSVITAMKLFINYVREDPSLLDGPLCHLVVQLVIRVLGLHRSSVVSPLTQSVTKSRQFYSSANRLVYRLVRYSAIVLLECVESKGCMKHIAAGAVASILVEIGYFTNAALIDGLIADQTPELLRDVVDLYTGVQTSLLGNTLKNVLAEATLMLLLEVYTSYMSFVPTYFKAHHTNYAEDFCTEIVSKIELPFRYIPDALLTGKYLEHLQSSVLSRAFDPITTALETQLQSQSALGGNILDPDRFFFSLASCFNLACSHVLNYLQLEHGTDESYVLKLIDPSDDTVFSTMYARVTELYGVSSYDSRLCLRFIQEMAERYVHEPIGREIIAGMEALPEHFEILLRSLSPDQNLASLRLVEPQGDQMVGTDVEISSDRASSVGIPASLQKPIQEQVQGQNPSSKTEKTKSSKASRIPHISSLSNVRQQDMRSVRQISLKASLAMLNTDPAEAIKQIHEYTLRDSGCEGLPKNPSLEIEYSSYLETNFAPLLATTYYFQEAEIARVLISLRKIHTTWLLEHGIEASHDRPVVRSRPGANGYMSDLAALEAQLGGPQ